MIEAVNSVLSNSASTTRVAVEQQSTARSYAANPEKIQEVAKTPYVSPYISIDRNSNRAILQIRDSDTGDVLRQYPTESQLRAYRNAQETASREELVQTAVTGNEPSTPRINAPSSNSEQSTPTGSQTASPSSSFETEA